MIHPRRVRTVEREIQVIPCVRQNKTSKSAKYPAERAKNREETVLNAVFVEKVTLWKDVDPNHFNSMAEKQMWAADVLSQRDKWNQATDG